MTRQTSWQRFVQWFTGGSAGTATRAAPAAGGPDAHAEETEPALLRGKEETWLEALGNDLGEGRRTDVVGSEEFWTHIDSLWNRQHELLCIRWLTKFIEAPATPDEQALALRARLVDMLDRRGEIAEGMRHLEALSLHPDHSLRAHYLLAEHYRRQGDEVPAIRHYEAVLAQDVDYPNVTSRLRRLRAARGEIGQAAVGQTLAEDGFVGAASGVRYRLLRELGRGATGVVYLARDTELERNVAVKLLHPHLAGANNKSACQRFFEEARISASLRHPNIIAILDLDEKARRIVMELTAGGTLRSVLGERGPRTMRRAVERHLQILSALNAAHRRGVVHRDVKPANLMFRRDPDTPGAEIVLGDFGIAHLPDAAGETGATAAKLRKPAEAEGTLAYMSPEQRRAAPLDPRSDLYAAAVVLYEMLVGRTPWSKEDLLAGTRRASDFTLPHRPAADESVDLRNAVQAHLQRLGDPDPLARPDTPAALQEALELHELGLATGAQTGRYP